MNIQWLSSGHPLSRSLTEEIASVAETQRANGGDGFCTPGSPMPTARRLRRLLGLGMRVWYDSDQPSRGFATTKEEENGPRVTWMVLSAASDSAMAVGLLSAVVEEYGHVHYRRAGAGEERSMFLGAKANAEQRIALRTALTAARQSRAQGIDRRTIMEGFRAARAKAPVAERVDRMCARQHGYVLTDNGLYSELRKR